ncbi:FmdB family zinc ribbon protein [Chloroflexota bacterium]
MPIYEYSCSNCGCQFELLRPFSKSDEDASCPSCMKVAKKKLSGFASFSKGSDGVSVPVAGGGGGCSSCSSSGCSTCG